MFGLSGVILYILFDILTWLHACMHGLLPYQLLKRWQFFTKSETRNQKEYVNVTRMIVSTKVYPIGQIMLLCKCTSLWLFDNHVELNRWLKMHWMGFVIDDRRESNDECVRVPKLCQTVLWKTMCLVVFLFCFYSNSRSFCLVCIQELYCSGILHCKCILQGFFLFHLFWIQASMVVFFSCLHTILLYIVYILQNMYAYNELTFQKSWIEDTAEAGLQYAGKMRNKIPNIRKHKDAPFQWKIFSDFCIGIYRMNYVTAWVHVTFCSTRILKKSFPSDKQWYSIEFDT